MENEDQVTQEILEVQESAQEVAQEINEELTQEFKQESDKLAEEKSERQKNWSQRTYFIVDDNDEVVANGFQSEKDCKKWIASEESLFDMPYTVGYACYNQKAMVKSQKTVVK
jgi:D-hexose-6-phosphate mutarotase